MNYWLTKCEPNVYSIDDLHHDGSTGWEGVRNYQARNFMKQMAIGDTAFFYHSNANPSGIVGVVNISRSAFPDPYQFDPTHRYFDSKSTIARPTWVSVEVQFHIKFPAVISLADLHAIPELQGMEVLRKGSRLSIQPVRPMEFELIIKRFGT